MPGPDPAIPIVDLSGLDDRSRRLWSAALTVMEELAGPWTLVGGLMVQLHAVRHELRDLRITVDVDILADSRRRPSGTERVGSQLARMGFAPTSEDILRDPPTAFRFRRHGLTIDLLAPEHGGWRSPPLSVDGFQTLEVAGGTQALQRSEQVTVALDGRHVNVRCPNLLGALLMKAQALASGNRPKDRDDLVILLACVDDPLSLRSELRRSERRWLRRVERATSEENVEPPSGASPGQIAQARAALRLLAQAPA